MHIKQKGVGLIEVLVSMMILAVGLLGTASLQTLSLREGVKSNFNGAAQMLTNDMIARMLANEDIATDGNYDEAPLSAEPTPNCRAAACTGAEMATHDLWEVTDRLTNQTALPNAALSISFTTATQEYHIALTWDAGSGGGPYSAPVCTAATNKNAGCLFTVVRF